MAFKGKTLRRNPSWISCKARIPRAKRDQSAEEIGRRVLYEECEKNGNKRLETSEKLWKIEEENFEKSTKINKNQKKSPKIKKNLLDNISDLRYSSYFRIY